MTILSALIDGIVLSIILYGGLFLMIRINPRVQLHNYPPQVRNAVPPKTAKEKKLFLILAIPILLLMLVYLIISFYLKFDHSITYINMLLYCVFVYFVMCCIDLFICDYLIFCTITPKFIIISGTEGNQGYKDKSYHTNTIPGMIIIIIIGALFTSLLYFLMKTIV